MELFYFDIETVGNYKNFNEFQLNDEVGSSLFKKKHEKMWPDKNIDDSYLENAGIISTYGKIVCISYGFLENDGTYFIRSITGDEIDILKKFNIVLDKVKSKNFNLSGYRIIHFDIPWVLHKCHKYDIKPSDIILTHGKKPWEMNMLIF